MQSKGGSGESASAEFAGGLLFDQGYSRKLYRISEEGQRLASLPNNNNLEAIIKAKEPGLFEGAYQR